MLAADIHALHNLVHVICAKSQLSSQIDAQAVLDGILNETRRALADVAYHLNLSRAIIKLPREILATCFSFLPFHCRVSASHVSRAWRTAAIHTPCLWADIMDGADTPRLTAPLIQRALLRAASVPINFESCHAVDGDMFQIIRESMHRVKSLIIRAVQNTSFLEQSAPLLHTLQLGQSVRLTADFLARTPGRLTVLQTRELHFPASCPGLSNLTTLSITACGDRTLQDIFRICPRLRTLSLTSLFWTNAEKIGRVPDSLTDLTLAAVGNRSNVITVYESFRHCTNLKRVSLDQIVTGPGHNVGSTLNGSANLEVMCSFAQDIMTFTARFADGRYLALTLRRMLRYTRPAFPPMFAHGVDFSQLHVLRTPLSVLPAFPGDALHNAEVYVEIAKGMDCTVPDAYPWHLLRSLTYLAPRRVVLDVAASADEAPTSNDARALVSELANSAATSPIVVQGFSPGAVMQDLGLVHLLDITFDCQTHAQRP